MRIFGLLRADVDAEAGVPPTPELMEKMGAFVEEVMAAGVLESTDGFLPTSAGKLITLENDNFTVRDGPFGRIGETNSAYAIYNVPSWDEAVHWTKRFLEVLGGGTCELRPFFEMPEGS
jgi:hypothetical protein